MNKITCVKSMTGSSIDILLTNRPISFHLVGVFETGLSDCHKLVHTFSKAYFKKPLRQTIKYQNYKNSMKKSLYAS